MDKRLKEKKDIHIFVDKEVWEDFKALAKARGTKATTMIREIMIRYVKRNRKEIQEVKEKDE